jgi:hypothetical protein
MKRVFKGAAGYTAVKRAIKGSAPSVADRYMRVTPRPGRGTPSAGPQEVAQNAAYPSASGRRGVNAQQQREANDQRDRDLSAAEALELQADRLTAARLNGRVPQSEIDVAGELSEELRRQSWALKESHGFIRDDTYSTAEVDRYFVSVDPWATSAELRHLADDGSPRITMQALLVLERRLQGNLSTAAAVSRLA